VRIEKTIMMVKILQKKISSSIVLALLLALHSHDSFAQVDTDVTGKTKALYSNLKKIQNGDTFLFGQEFFNSFKFSSGAAHGDKEFSDSKEITGSHPAVLGSDFHYYLEKDATERGYHKEAVKWAYQQGYVITFDWHLSARGTASYAYSTASKDLANNIVADLNGDRAWFYGEMDKVIEIINKDLVVGQDTIPIVFRPLHEMNGNWFWWGSSATNATNYKALYALMVNYIKARTKSVLFCWSPNSPFTTTHYPGNDLVDVVGVDAYEVTTGSVRTHLGLLVDFADANNKVAVFAETGNRVTTDNASTYWKDVVLPGITDDPSGKAKRIAWALTWINSSWSNPYVAHSGTGTAAKQSFIDFKNSPYLQRCLNYSRCWCSGHTIECSFIKGRNSFHNNNSNSGKRFKPTSPELEFI
jgi:mannan endo-1,4-beta-mannosidase